MARITDYFVPELDLPFELRLLLFLNYGLHTGVKEKPSISDGRVRCSRRKGNWRCACMFVPDVNAQGKPHRRCEICRAATQRANTSEAGQAAKQRYAESELGQEAEKRYKEGEAGQAAAKRYKKGEAGKAAKQRYQTGEAGKAATKRYKTGEAGQARDKRYKEGEAFEAKEKRYKRGAAYQEAKKRLLATMSFKLAAKIRKMCRKGAIDSVSALQATGCASAAELRAHFQSTFEPWMTWRNRGEHKAGGNSGTWQTGHRLARAFYSDSNPVDIKRCWNKANLFAQNSDENHALSVKMPDDAVLERLRELDLLPCAWNGIVPPMAERAEMERIARR